MITTIVPIGNSKGIRIPKVVLEQCNIDKEVILEVEKNKIVIMPTGRKPRKNWARAFKMMSEAKDDTQIIDDNIDLDSEEWKW